MSEARTVSPESGQPGRRRSLLEEIKRVKEGSVHRRIWRIAARTASQSASRSGLAGVDSPAHPSREISDASAVRRGWQLRRRLKRAFRAAVAAGCVLLATVAFEGRQTAAEASAAAGEFLQAGSQNLWGRAREERFSSCLKQAEPPDRFVRDIQLLQAKLGKLVGFRLNSTSPSLTERQCQLQYAMDFERGAAQGFFELTHEDGRWVVDTFCFWAPRWKQL